MRLTIEISDEKIKTAAKLAGMKKSDFMKTEKDKIEDVVGCYLEKSCRLISKEELDSLEETEYMENIPGMKDKILRGMNTPLSECVGREEI